MKEQSFEILSSVGIIRGSSILPDSGKYDLLFLMHGFTGEMNGPKYLIKRFGNLVAEKGIGVVKFDHIGCGNSGGEFTENMITSSISGAKEVVQHFLNSPLVRQVFLHGFSMGGMIAVELAKQLPHTFDKLLLWSPAFSMANLLDQIYANSPRVNEFTVDYFGIEITKEVVDDAKKYDSYSFENKKTSVCIIAGEMDNIIPVDVVRIGFERFNCSKELHIIAGAIHTYDDLNQRFDLYRQSINFLIKTKLK